VNWPSAVRPSISDETDVASDEIDASAHIASGLESAPEVTSRSPGGVRRILFWFGWTVGLPLAGFALVRPDWFSRANGIDEFFYTGYAQNLGDVIAMSGDGHYFVSRWTVYLPNRLFFKLFGAETGFLVLRWVFAVLICLAIVALGNRRWRRSDTISMLVLVLLTPMLLRPLFSDYIDSFTVPAGFICIVLVALWPRTRSTAIVVGALTAAIAIANPIAVAIIICLVPAWIRELGWSKGLAKSGVLASAAFSAVILSGLILFRVRYGIPNVYAPTIDFLKAHSSYLDPQKSPRLWWMGYRIWIYIPLIIIAMWQYLARAIHVEFDRAERVIMTTCAVQFAFQVWYQFSRHGSTLEISYYWSTMVPVLVLSFCVVLGKLVAHAHRFLLAGVAASVLLAVLVWRSDMPQLFGSWLDALLLLLLVAVVWRRKGPYARSFGAWSLVLIVFTFQVAAPRPEPLLPGESPIVAAYHTVYDGTTSEGIDGYRAATWFSERMKSLGSPLTQSAFFWIGGGHAHQMAAMFSAHVDYRWLNPGWGSDSPGLGLSKDFEFAIGHGVVNVIVMLGTADDIGTMSATLDRVRPGYRVVFEGTAPDKPHTQALVATYD
jgi:hypothetical protein